MITLKTTWYKPDDYKFIRIVFRNGMEKVFSCYRCNTIFKSAYFYDCFFSGYCLDCNFLSIRIQVLST